MFFVWRLGRRTNRTWPTLVRRCLCSQLNLDVVKPNAEYDNLLDKILYNTFIHGIQYSYKEDMAQRKYMEYQRKRELYRLQKETPLPHCLSYMPEANELLEWLNEKTLKENSWEEEEPENPERNFNLPLAVTENYLTKENVEPDPLIDNSWMTSYEHFDDSLLNKKKIPEVHTSLTRVQKNYLSKKLSTEIENESNKIEFNYGHINRRAKLKNIPCGGCGALLHCNESSIPGYLPSEIFLNATETNLQSALCQRCHFLKDYNIALDVRVQPEEYPRILMQIKPKIALVILIVDLLDFPCSIWPNMLDIIGQKRPVYVVGNKVDLLPKDSEDYLMHIKNCLRTAIIDSGISKANIKSINLISAKTGYGVENLITSLFTNWQHRGDVYLMGSTNVGKSSLFNLFLQSDYCKATARELMQKATISKWPGTTLNLLKFPIFRASGWKLRLRAERLKQIPFEKDKRISLIQHIDITFKNPNKVNNAENDDQFLYNEEEQSKKNNDRDQFANSKWCFDTPGVVHPDQILSLLTLEELLLTLPDHKIIPRVVTMKKGWTFFLAGLGRIDIEECEFNARLTVFASSKLPITICKTEDAEKLYETLLTTSLLSVPSMNKERLEKWPKMRSHRDSFTIHGNGWMESSSDIVLSSAGWVSVSGEVEHEYKLRAWTPGGKGIHLRKTSLLPYAVKFRGKQIRGTPAFTVLSPCNGRVKS